MKTRIGGQAVIEGVMMRGDKSMALSVRDEAGNIRVETTRLPSRKPWYRKVPFLRGVINLFVSMVDGFKIISKSAEIMAEEELDDGDEMGGVMFLSILLGLGLAVGLFILLPTFITGWLTDLLGIAEVRWAKSLIEGLIKIVILICYMTAVALMPEIKRVFMYHGAEHKTIACYEAELPLTVENVQKCSRYHDRCGTSFIVFVVVLSVFLMMCVEAVCYAVGFEAISVAWVRALVKLAMLPLTAGVSYEMLMLLSRSNFFLFVPLKWLGKQFQKITTREPDDSMCEVAISSFNLVLSMDADESIEEVKFPSKVTIGELRESAEQLADYSTMESCDVDWILCALLNKKRTELVNETQVAFGYKARVQRMVKECAEGKPLQYVLGNTEFYGRTFALNENVLIPRMETELVCEQLVKRINSTSDVLDMCCGSGVLGITAQLEKGCKVTLCDVSNKALEVAKYNAKNLKAKARFVCGNMFSKISGKFNAIVCNPPYVATDVIATLDAKVKDYEPVIALDGGKDGLDFYRIIADNAHKYLLKGGVLVLEIGYDQGISVPSILTRYNCTVIKDYDGNDRIVVAELKE